MASPQRPTSWSPSSSDHEEQDQDQSSDREQEQPSDHEEQHHSSPDQPSSSQQTSSSEQQSTIQQHKFKRATPQPKAKIIAHLESLLNEVETAMATSNFDPSTPPWSTHFHPSFTAEVGMLANSPSKKKIPLADFCAFTAERRRLNPEYRMSVKGISTNVNTRRGKAECFVNLELEGVPVGIVRPSVACVGFECHEGEWLFVRWGSLRGVGGFE